MNGTRKAPFTITETLPQVSLADFELVSLRYDDQTRYISQFVDAAIPNTSHKVGALWSRNR